LGPRAGLEGAEYLALTGIRSLDRPAGIGSLYRLNCPMIIRAILQLVICRNSRHFQIDSECLCKYFNEIVSSRLHLFNLFVANR
jgi:hypothetical protein